MMASDMTEPSAGERRLIARRRNLWRFVGLGFAGAAVAGFALGVLGAAGEERWIDPRLLWPALALATVLWVWFTVGYFRRVDELDLADNLWAAMIAVYVYVPLFPSWALLHYAGQLPPVDGWAVWWTTMAVMTLTYLGRKLRARMS